MGSNQQGSNQHVTCFGSTAARATALQECSERLQGQERLQGAARGAGCAGCWPGIFLPWQESLAINDSTRWCASTCGSFPPGILRRSVGIASSAASAYGRSL